MMQSWRNFCQAASRYGAQTRRSSTSVKDEWKKRKNLMFNCEKKTQEESIGRLEKITVVFRAPTDEIHLKMNKHLSTPFDAAFHVSEQLTDMATLALVDNVPWDMNRPFERDCELRILTMAMPKESPAVNSTFWRSCSVMFGAVIDSAFKDDISMYLHSFPWPNIRAGSFVYDVVLDLPNWSPTKSELQALSAQFVQLANNKVRFERLQVTEELALDMFQENPFKTKQIPDIAKNNDNKVTLYRLGDHIDISKGPLIGNTGIIGRCTVSAVHKLESEETDNMYRFQGIALPKGFLLNHFAYGILEDRARELNKTMWMPHKESEELVNTKVAASI